MKIEIQKKRGENTYSVSYIIKSGKRKTGGVIGIIHSVENYFVFMLNGIPINVMNKLSEMDGIIHKTFGIKPSYVNLMF